MEAFEKINRVTEKTGPARCFSIALRKNSSQLCEYFNDMITKRKISIYDVMK